ncbi:MAG: hypothetical protein RLZZ347_762 [Candidatus Parcubacteria bacterium]|jgi:succinylglutamate desuccinylase
MKDIPTFSREIFAEAFKALMQSNTYGLSGVHEINSGKPGPTIGITLHTHGNEPSGLAIFHYFTQIEPLNQKLKAGRVLFVLNNIKATAKYLDATDREGRENSRFIDVNMNRLPPDLDACGRCGYEIQRSIELIPVWKQFQIALDIHSTTQPCPPMIIALPHFNRSLVQGIPAQTILSNITSVQIGKPAISFYGQSEVERCMFGIETGSHESQDSFVCGITSVEALLVNTGVLERQDVSQKPVPITYLDYWVDASVIFPDTTYSLTKIFGSFDRINKGEILATGDGANIEMPFDGHTLFCRNKTKPTDLSEEILFLAKPAVEFTL